jgi:hypothetical protein
MKVLRSLLLCLLVFASNVQAADTFRFGSRIVEVGDSVAKLVEIGGSPVYKEPIESKEGGHQGERWQYSQDGGTVTFVIKDSKITAIEQKRN